MIRLLRTLAPLAVALLATSPVRAWDVFCADLETGTIKCPDPFASARTPWLHPRNEHSRLLTLSIQLAGLPSSLAQPFDLVVFTDGRVLEVGESAYPAVRPVRIDAERRQVRRLSIPMMANFPTSRTRSGTGPAGTTPVRPIPARIRSTATTTRPTSAG